MKKIFLIFLCLSLFIKPVLASKLDLKAKSAILIDFNTGNVLFSKNEHEKLPMASMTKIMSLILIMEAIEKETISLDTEVVISENASSMGGSQIYLATGDKYKVRELVKGVAMASANDAIVALAERCQGSVEAFVNKMNEKAQMLGLNDTHFVNPHGLDTENHYSSAYDMALMAKELLKHEEILKYTSVYEEYLQKNDGSKIWLVNTNKLVRFYDGVDGLKTGYTLKAGYCITLTAMKNNMRLIGVLMGEDTIDDRSSDSVKMLNYGFNAYKVNLIKSKDEKIGTVRVQNGKEKFADVRLINDATELLNVNDEVSKYNFKMNIDKIKAPVNVGDIIGKVQIFNEDGKILNEVDITVTKNIKKANLWDLIKRNFENVLTFN